MTFGALNANVRDVLHSLTMAFVKAGVAKENTVVFSWLPQYHDLGLIYAMIAPFAGGWSCNMISPIDFIKNPLLWIDLISRLKVN